VTFTYFGQSMFTLKVEGGPTIMMDPVGANVGYKVSAMTGIDVVTVSHEHSDHNNLALASGTPKILRGLTGTDWSKVDETVQGVRFRTINTYHDDAQGSARGKNAIFIVEANGMKIVHVGDLGHLLNPEQIAAIGSVDVLMIPVGGFFTVDAPKATQVVESLKPRAVIPMHYKTPAVQLTIEPVDAFLAGKTVQRASGNQLILNTQTLPKTTTVLVPGYEPAQTMSMPALGKVAVGTGYYTNISPDELKAMLAKKDFVFVNVHIPYAGEIADTDLFIPYNEIDKNTDKLPNDKGAKMVIYCRSGMMSTPASETLVKSGYTNVFNLAGGMNAWSGKQYPLLNKAN
jgi:L-ascorbate metabolism protein UlaG (beta-lactamase superfamily)/rhodanese-related sulfurtransferase